MNLTEKTLLVLFIIKFTFKENNFFVIKQSGGVFLILTIFSISDDYLNEFSQRWDKMFLL